MYFFLFLSFVSPSGQTGETISMGGREIGEKNNIVNIKHHLRQGPHPHSRLVVPTPATAAAKPGTIKKKPTQKKKKKKKKKKKRARL
jgi:hypothetical protein